LFDLITVPPDVPAPSIFNAHPILSLRYLIFEFYLKEKKKRKRKKEKKNHVVER